MNSIILMDRLDMIDFATRTYIIGSIEDRESFERKYLKISKLDKTSTFIDEIDCDDFMKALYEMDCVILSNFNKEELLIKIQILNLSDDTVTDLSEIEYNDMNNLFKGEYPCENLDIYQWVLNNHWMIVAYSESDGNTIDTVKLISLETGETHDLNTLLAKDLNYKLLRDVKVQNDNVLLEFTDSERPSYKIVSFELSDINDKLHKNEKIVCEVLFEDDTDTRFSILSRSETGLVLSKKEKNMDTANLIVVDRETQQSRIVNESSYEYIKSFGNAAVGVVKTNRGFEISSISTAGQVVKSWEINVAADHINVLSITDDNPLFRLYGVEEAQNHFENIVLMKDSNYISIIGKYGYYDEKADCTIIYN